MMEAISEIDSPRVDGYMKCITFFTLIIFALSLAQHLVELMVNTKSWWFQKGSHKHEHFFDSIYSSGFKDSLPVFFVLSP